MEPTKRITQRRSVLKMSGQTNIVTVIALLLPFCMALVAFILAYEPQHPQPINDQHEAIEETEKQLQELANQVKNNPPEATASANDDQWDYETKLRQAEESVARAREEQHQVQKRLANSLQELREAEEQHKATKRQSDESTLKLLEEHPQLREQEWAKKELKAIERRKQRNYSEPWYLFSR